MRDILWYKREREYEDEDSCERDGEKRDGKMRVKNGMIGKEREGKQQEKDGRDDEIWERKIRGLERE